MGKHRDLKWKQSKSKEPIKGHIDYQLFIIVLLLSLFGIVMVFDSSATLLASKYHFVLMQSLWVVIGLLALAMTTYIDYKKLLKFIVPIIIVDIILLFVVLVIGQKANGAVRWISLGPFEFQPSEVTKPIYILYIAAFFAKEKPLFTSLREKMRYRFMHELLPFVILTLLIITLVVAGRDLGTAIVLGVTGILLYFIQGSDFLNIIYLVGTGLLFSGLGFLAIFLEPYRLQRLMSFSGNGSNTQSGGYEIHQILIAIGSGGWLGKGFTQSIQKQHYLVETTAATDSIFAVIAEEFGFIGSSILLLAYVWLFLTCINITSKVEDRSGQLICAGITIWIITQAFLNIAVNVNLAPLTGIPLPFISYGGSSMIILLGSIGIMLNISKTIPRYEKEKTTGYS